MDARRVEGSRWPPGHSAQPTVSYIPSNSGGEGNTVQPRWRWGLGSRGPMPDLHLAMNFICRWITVEYIPYSN